MIGVDAIALITNSPTVNGVIKIISSFKAIAPGKENVTSAFMNISA
jgi:hypothetical protein